MAVKCPKCQSDNTDSARFCSNCATRLTQGGQLPDSLTKTLKIPAHTLAKGTLIAGKYQIIDEIGRGGMGIVYRAHDAALARDVAIKLLPPEFASDPERLRRFEQEAKAVGQLSHPNILVVHDVGSHEGAPYLVTELLEGESLRQRLDGGELPMRQAIDYGVQIARGLAVAHEKGIVHRDLKPENLFLTQGGFVKILDFGLAKLRSAQLYSETAIQASTMLMETEVGAVVGTVPYMSPEQVRGQAIDQRTDIFSFGAVLYEMLSGYRAFKGGSSADIMSAILKEDPPPLTEIRQAVSAALQQIIDRCLEKRPEDRFSSAHDLSLALEAFSAGSTTARQQAAVPGAGAAAAVMGGVRRLATPLIRLWPSGRAKRWLWLAGGLSVLAVLVVASIAISRQRRISWARNQALPELMRLADARDYWPAFRLAKKIEAVVPGDPTVEKLRPRFAGEFTRPILPAGSKLLARPRDSGEADWVELGEARGKPIPTPLGYSIFKVQYPGLELREFAMIISEYKSKLPEESAIVLARRDELPDGMVRIETPAKKIYIGLAPGFFAFEQMGHVPSFFVDTHEVTNREYKRFVDAGGYQKREYWKEPFERDGKMLAWDEAMALFRDATGRPGPAAWEVAAFPKGKDEFPVTGVSWYEAAAYAAFAGKRLPSVYHWAVTAVPHFGSDFVPGSNFSGSLASVGSYRGGFNYWGLYDIAGNAGEWCSNASAEERFILGGACDGPAYMFWSPPVTRSPFDRNPSVGFRCVKPAASDSQEAQLDQPIAKTAPDYRGKEKPFSEEAWNTWQGLISYAKGPLDARVEWADDSLPSWRMEKVSFAAAYGNERVVAYLFLPKKAKPPWQVVIFWPGAYAGYVNSSQDGRNTLDLSYWDYLVKDGRAVLYPILNGSFERGGGSGNIGDTSLADCIPHLKDIFRSIDYLETRPDIQKDRIGFLGFSAGANAGPFLCAVEARFKAAVLLGGGTYIPEWFGFSQRCTVPIQMINGSSDGFTENHAPLFNALGAPADKKRHLVFDADHSLAGFEKDVIKANLEWFDRFLGPVR